MRLDEFLTAREGFELRISISLIMTGKVLVDGVPETKPGRSVSERNVITLRERPREFPSRSGEKLRGAIDEFQPAIAGRICLDLGAAHGGFTSVLLDAGASRVYAIDVAKGMLDYDVRRRPEVRALDRRNVRDISADWFDPDDLKRTPWFVACDIAFLSLTVVLETLSRFARENAVDFEGVFLLKPQFEAPERTEKGIMKDEIVIQQILKQMLDFVAGLGYGVLGHAPARLRGRKGNQEYCLYLSFRIS